MAQRRTEESSAYDTTTVGIFRTAATIKGGRRFSFGAMVVVGDRNGTVGYGYGKANEVPSSIDKAKKDGQRNLRKIPLKGSTIPHTVEGRFGASMVKLVPASPGTGVVAGAAVRAVLELAGIQDCLTKAYGSTNKKNLVKATMNGLEQLRTAEEIAELRGIDLPETRVDEMIRHGAKFMGSITAAPKADDAADEGDDTEAGKTDEENAGQEPAVAGKSDAEDK
ncbi:MAG TPA: 30S ribosomal protein S5 [Phycisphaeraceae bacterium]|nr:30S ribosomal protein S5 [Phycisphaeraceae bacterium]